MKEHKMRLWVALFASLCVTVAEAALPLLPGQAVATCDGGVLLPPATEIYAVGIIDIRDPACDPTSQLGVNWMPAMYHNEMPNPTGNPADVWSVTNIGHVFGLALDDASPPNIYVALSSVYSSGPGTGEVKRLDGVTGAISLFATLPNSGQGLGNIAFDAQRQQFYVTNHEDGALYRLDMTGSIASTFDPFTADDGTPGFAPLGERLWAVGQFLDRVYFSVWQEDMGRPDMNRANTIWSVALDGAGDFDPTDVTLEVTIPMTPIPLGPYSNPVSDIAFSTTGNMMLAERSMQVDDATAAHESRILEYTGGHLAWLPSGASFSIGEVGLRLENSAGGVAYACDVVGQCGAGPLVWATGDALDFATPDYVYGMQGFPVAGGAVASSYIIDFDGSLLPESKTFLGDVEIYNVCPTCIDQPIPEGTWTGTACVGGMITLDASFSRGCGGQLEYRWLDGAVEVCPWSVTPTCDVTITGMAVYELEVRCIGDPTCARSRLVTVDAWPTPIPIVTASSQFCEGDLLVIDASQSDPNGCTTLMEFQYRDGATILQAWGTNPNYGPVAVTQTRLYTVDVRCGGCEASFDVPVDVVPVPTAAAGPDRVICEGDPIELDAAGSTDPGCPGGLVYEWWQGATLVRAADPDPRYTPPSSPVGTVTYTVIARCSTLQGCESSDPVDVTINPCVLAVAFDAFDAVRSSGGIAPVVEVTWQTVMESGTLGFVIERSTGLHGSFVDLGVWIDATGGGSEYRFVDDRVADGALHWYRIVEFTGVGRGDATPAFQAHDRAEKPGQDDLGPN